MHELPILRNLLSIALRRAADAGATRIVALELRIGALCDGEEPWLERYFRVASRGTIAEGATLRMEREPLVVGCSACGGRFSPDLPRVRRLACPSCGSRDCAIEGGSEYRLERMEVL